MTRARGPQCKVATVEAVARCARVPIRCARRNVRHSVPAERKEKASLQPAGKRIPRLLSIMLAQTDCYLGNDHTCVSLPHHTIMHNRGQGWRADPMLKPPTKAGGLNQPMRCRAEEGPVRKGGLRDEHWIQVMSRVGKKELIRKASATQFRF